MDVTKELLDRMMQVGASSVPAVLVYEDETRKVMRVVKTNGDLELVDFMKEPPARDHGFSSLEGFLEYLNSPHCTHDSGVVFVGNDIVADLNYRNVVPHRAGVELKLSAEYMALGMLLDNPLLQKDLWRMLVTQLNGCIAPSLLLAISQIRVKASDESSVKIALTGLSDRQAAASVSVLYPDPSGKCDQTANIPVDWDWTGRLWEPFDHETVIQLRLEVVVADGLRFRFHAANIERVQRSERQALVEKIRGALPSQFTCYEGTL
jgi:hypothetical protein